MFDCSRNGVLKMETVKRYIEYLALLGMNDLLLYTEDTYEIPEYPHFGALRGRYTKEEIHAMEQYAENLESKWYRVFRRWRIFGRTCGGRSQKR